MVTMPVRFNSECITDSDDAVRLRISTFDFAMSVVMSTGSYMPGNPVLLLYLMNSRMCYCVLYESISKVVLPRVLCILRQINFDLSNLSRICTWIPQD